MSYDYVKRAYGLSPVLGARVQHTETHRFGKIMRCRPSAAHYIFVRFDGDKHPLPCHPLALDYAPLPPEPSQ